MLVAFVGVAAVRSSAVARQHAPAGSAWQRLLATSEDLGPSRARAAEVLVTLAGWPPSSARRLERWASGNGLLAHWFPGQRWATLSGPPTTLGVKFGVSVHDFSARSGERFYASLQAPKVPPALHSVLAGIGRISSYSRPVTAYVPDGGLTPTGLDRAYDATPLIQRGDQGQGETVVFFEFTPFSQADLNQFAKRFGLPPFDVATVNGIAPGGSGSLGEADMDIETVHEIAPRARLVYYNIGDVGTATDAQFSAALASAFADAARRFPGAVWSLSLGSCEQAVSSTDLAAMDDAVASAESTGTTVFASSGDTGGSDCGQFGEDSVSSGKGVWYPAVLPAVTGVGGTSLSVTTSGDYLGETVWSMPMMSQGSGGGVSTVIPRPSWQVGTGVGQSPYREVPDVSAVADPTTGNAIVVGGSGETGGGTSLAAPVWAGFTALIDEYLAASGAKPIGFANPVLYELANDHRLSPPPFHDVTVGSNDFYAAGPGYDPVTGLGSPDVAALAQYLLQIERGGR
ncbi:MAG TPA: S53 family peptidase [Acidimicrobiales bacterium]|nr:S53 family peptidase [Acidimicrobiales bacterium]